MTQFQFFKQWISVVKKSRIWIDVLGILFCLGVFFFNAPADVLNSEPATGGDTGSHYWPLVTLVQEGLPNWQVRIWNPGNLGGEPHHTHYFPLPYLLMALLSLFMPLGKAFNIGTILPLVVFPISLYVCLRALKTRFPFPILAAVASLSFLYNESFSMWGGNALSTLAGQFAHIYAFNFLLLGIGSLYWEIEKKRFPWLSVLFFAAVLLSHFYIALYLPLVFVCFLFFQKTETFKSRVKTLFQVGILALGLAAWFVIPMVHNAKWTTPYGLKWEGSQLFQEAFPFIFWPFAAIGALFCICYMIWRFPLAKYEKFILPLLVFLILGSVGYYFIFPPLGLVDVRVFPVLQLSLCLFAALSVSILFSHKLSRVWIWFLTPFLIAIGIWWAARQIHHFPYWMKWNYSGWQAKKAYPDLVKLSETVQGDFSKPRIIYENSELSNSAGTMRVFEMLPYFATRSTMESVYMQATILAPAAFYLQALISHTPSCPFPEYTCSPPNVSRLSHYMPLMGISEIITISPEVTQQADNFQFLKKKGQFGIWHLYESLLPAKLADVLRQTPDFVEEKNFKMTFYEWFKNWSGNEKFQVVAASEFQEAILQASQGTQSCNPVVQVDFGRLKLETDCPGKFHILKFAYHSTWKTDSGDRLFLTSPGFIGLIPSNSTVELKWGGHWLWTLANSISWMTLAVLIFLSVKKRKA